MKVSLVLDERQRKNLKVSEEWKVEKKFKMIDIIIYSNNIFQYFFMRGVYFNGHILD